MSRLRTAPIIGVLAVMAAGCGGGGGSVEAPPPSAAPPPGPPGTAVVCPDPGSSVFAATGEPVFEVTFPFEHAVFDREAISVSGKLDHDDLTQISVTACINGVGATTSIDADGWFVVDPLPVPQDRPEFSIDIEAMHRDGRSFRRSLTLERTPVLSYVPSITLDSSRGRLVGVDTASGAVFGIPLQGAAQTPQGAYRPQLIAAALLSLQANPFLVAPVAVTYAAPLDLYFVLDEALDAIVSIDPRSGGIALVSNPDTGTGPGFLRPNDIAWDAARNRIVVADDGRRALIAVDRVSGDRTIISDQATGVGPAGFAYRSMALDTQRSRALVIGNSSEVYAIDLASGDRSLVSDASQDAPDVSRLFTGMTVDTVGGVAWLTDSFSNAVVRMDVFSGARASISSSGLTTASLLIQHPVIGNGPLFEDPADAVFDPATGRLLVIENDFANALIEVDRTTGDRALLRDSSLGSGVSFRQPAGIVLNTDNTLAYVVDGIADIFATVALASGNRTLLDGPSNGRGTIETGPESVALDPASGLAYIVDFATDSLYTFDLASGAKTTIADALTGQGPALEAPVDLELDVAGGTAYVLDIGLDAIVSIDIATGTRALFSGNAEGMALDSANRRLYVIDAGGDEIHVIDLVSAQRSVVSSNQIGEGDSLGDAIDLALDTENGQLVVIDTRGNTIVTVDIATGNRAVISGDASLLALIGSEFVRLPRLFGGGPPLGRPQRIAVDAQRQVAYVTDAAYDAIVAIDLNSGFRQIIAK